MVERTDPAGDATPAPDSHRISIGVVELREGGDMADRMRDHLQRMESIARREGLTSEVVAIAHGRWVVDVLRWPASIPDALEQAMADPGFRGLHDTMLDECVVPESRRGFGAHDLFRTGEV